MSMIEVCGLTKDYGRGKGVRPDLLLRRGRRSAFWGRTAQEKPPPSAS